MRSIRLLGMALAALMTLSQGAMAEMPTLGGAVLKYGTVDWELDVIAHYGLDQQRRLALARAFAGAPKLLLMDEPFVSLDAALAGEMMALLETLRHKRPVTTLLITHVPKEAARLASRVLHLSGTPAQLQSL